MRIPLPPSSPRDARSPATPRAMHIATHSPRQAPMSRQPTDAAMMARYARADKRGAAAAGEARARSASPRGSGANQRIYEAMKLGPSGRGGNTPVGGPAV